MATVPWTVPRTAATIEKLRARTPLREKKAKKNGGMNRDVEDLDGPERLSPMAKLDELAKQESEYHRMLVELPPDISQLNTKTSALEATLSELQAALTILNEERTRLVGSLAATQQDLESAKSALVQMQSARETAQLTLQALRTEGDALRESSRSLEISMAELQLELASSQAERDELAATEQRLDEELASARRALHEQQLARQRCERLRSMVDDSRGSLAQTDAEVLALGLEVAAIEAEASVIRAQKAEAARELDRLAELHVRSRAEVRDRDLPGLLELELNWDLPDLTRLVRHGIKDVTVCDEARAFLGLYRLDEGAQVNGAPIWLHCEDRQRCIAFNREHGLWHAQQRSEAGAACGFFYRRCEGGQRSPHLSPHSEGSSWFLYTGNARTSEHSWLEDGVRCVVWSRLSAARVQTSATEQHVSLES